MVDKALNEQIEALVDSLRGRNETSLSLGEVASVTEVLVKTMKLYFRSLDVKIYEECQSLSDYITNARKEIASLQPENKEGARIPRAGRELEAIVNQTEEATDTIMDAAEKIMGCEATEMDAYKAEIQDQVMRIFEACSFQDITGQRISKVVETLSYIERRSDKLKNIMGMGAGLDGGLDGGPDHDIDDDEPPKRKDAHLLSGPALEGEGIDQNEVDALMGGNVGEPAASAPEEPAGSTSQAPEGDTPDPAPAQSSKSGEAEKKDGEDSKAKAEPGSSDENRTTQADIDALFG